jgi:ubiquinol-cytochrome c reductase cytochrome b subunit
MGAAIVVLFFLPWLDRSPVKSIRYRGMLYKVAIGVFVVSFIALGYLGTQPATPIMTNFARLFSLLYFGFFAALLIIPKFEKTKPVPDRVTS